MTTRARRLLLAAGATALALVALSGSGGSGASWAEHVGRSPGSISSGQVSVTPDPVRVELHSRQPAGSRTYASTTGCTPDAGYTECRVVTRTVAQEALVPGDRMVLGQRVEVAATGSNLTGEFTVDVSALTSSALSDFSGSGSTTTTVTPPGGDGRTGRQLSFPVSAAEGMGIGTYAVRTVITTPPSNGGRDWGTALQDQRLYDGHLTYGFIQS